MDIEALRNRIRERLPRATGRWYEIRNADSDVATIRIYDYIDMFGVTAVDFAAELDRVTAPRIEVQINSPGGDVWDGIAIFNALRSHPAHVTTRVDGMAASAASVIVQAGDNRVMLHAGQMMIHEAWGVCAGPADDMRAFAEVLDQQSAVIADIYATRADGDADEFRELMRAETWLTDQAAVDAGLADEVITPERQDAANSVASVESLIDRLQAALDSVNKIPAPVAGSDPEGEGHHDTDQVSLLRAVLAHKGDAQ